MDSVGVPNHLPMFRGSKIRAIRGRYSQVLRLQHVLRDQGAKDLVSSREARGLFIRQSHGYRPPYSIAQVEAIGGAHSANTWLVELLGFRIRSNETSMAIGGGGGRETNVMVHLRHFVCAPARSAG